MTRLFTISAILTVVTLVVLAASHFGYLSEDAGAAIVIVCTTLLSPLTYIAIRDQQRHRILLSDLQRVLELTVSSRQPSSRHQHGINEIMRVA